MICAIEVINVEMQLTIKCWRVVFLLQCFFTDDQCKNEGTCIAGMCLCRNAYSGMFCELFLSQSPTTVISKNVQKRQAFGKFSYSSVFITHLLGRARVPSWLHDADVKGNRYQFLVDCIAHGNS